VHFSKTTVPMDSENAQIGSKSILHVLRKRIVGDLRSGVLEHGDRLPSVREVGEELAVDPRAVLAAYQQLVEEGIVEIRDRSGVYATGAYTREGNATALPKRWILDTIASAIQRDIPPMWLADQIRDALQTRRARAALIECNTDQLESMREELVLFYGMEVVSLSLDNAISGADAQKLVDVDVIISAGHVAEIASIAHAAGKPYVIISVRPALVRRLSRLLTRGPFYFLIVDPRFGAKMRRLVAPMPRSENFHVLIVGQDDLGVIPANAPTYVMRSALTRVDAKRHAGREILPQRIFSEESSREILSRMLERAGGGG
jgi:DNA-binding transcriptional regulator YhcF (GntR family)